MWNKWKDEYLNICNRHAPFKEIWVKDRYNPWITSDIIKLMYKRDYIGNKAIINNNPDMMNEYRKLRNQVSHMIEQSKTDYPNDMSLLYYSDRTGLWKDVHKIAGSHKHVNNIHPNLDSNEFNTLFCKSRYKDIKHV